ncbi:ribosome small subunit-dependent GTPase A [Mesomycoplasma ovipneumoniae]|uniref:ribosome small subunit-dependent GTPase A n=1 Tax=Mesomycoplasma ovipneumoniae TaxID=29562 RepID=UPI0028AF5882|nr:ribosome small subunit-dependent GTPase A [Mesomycoplasma ovipneumoniae]WNM14817.1 ribosome small subunit-dependent GTPase A [Mesomycoplasma ovipneumoniae]
MKGQIVRVIAGFYDVFEPSTQKLYPLLRGSGSLRQKQISPLVGDFVEFDPSGFIKEIFPRKNWLKRPKVANIDQALIFVSLKEPNFSPLLLDTFLLMIEFKNISPILIVTKVDLEPNYKNLLLDYQKMGYSIFFINNNEKKIPSDLQEKIKNKLNFVIGQSGVGKTSFINNLFGTHFQVQQISFSLNRGKHTTRVVQIIRNGDFQIVDTPGFSSFNYDEIPKDQIKSSFEIFRQFLPKCKFRTCFHFHEPIENCAVKNAVKHGIISETRYKNYLYLLEKYEKKDY